MQDRPNDQELIAAVIGFMEQEIIPTLSDPRLRFRGLIAANVLSLVARELAAGDESLRDEWRRLVALLNQPKSKPPCRETELRSDVEVLNRDLCARIRAGEADEEPWSSAIFEHVQMTVVEKLRIANPRYLDRVLK
jgi:hypothetical protein